MGLDACRVLIDERGRELVEHGTALFPVGCYHDDLEEQEVPWHWHEELEAMVVECGQAVVSVGGKSCTLRPGQGLVVNTEALHGAWHAAAGRCRLRSLVFHPRLVGGSVDSIFYQGYLQPLLSDAAQCASWWLEGSASWHRAALEAINSAWEACVREPAGFEFLVREHLSRLIFLLTEHRQTGQKLPTEKALRDGERIKRMLEYIEENFEKPLTTAMIARRAAVSESECLRCFRAMMGTPPIRYLKQLRLQRAAELLAGTELRIADIGARCGFQDMSYFARSFRAVKGCTPGEYRKKKRQSV